MLAGLSLLPLYMFGFDRLEGDRMQLVGELRASECQNLAVAIALHIRRQDNTAVKQQLDLFLKSTPHALGAKVVRFDGMVIASIGDQSAWHLQPGDPSDSSNVRIAIRRDGRDWGQLEAIYNDNHGQMHAMKHGMLVMGAIMSINCVVFILILRRMNKALDAGSSVPRRVRNTLDTIAGGVVVLDAHRKIVLANEAFAKCFSSAPTDLVGKSLDEFGWSTDSVNGLPWHRAIDGREQCSGETLSVKASENSERKWFVVNATPVYDANDQLAGALISFEDVTMLEAQRQTLVDAMQELEASREQVRAQNKRLQELASRDALTGIMNRRELFERLEQHWNEFAQTGTPIGCMMLDVDHFKRLNDTHGHAIGDVVLKNVARTLESTVGDRAIVARYGGEEFCVVTQLNAELTNEIGEAVRRQIAVDLCVPYAVTTSVGVSHGSFGAKNFQEMLEQADKALYAAKHGGRNAVRCWSPEMEAIEAEKAATSKAKKVSDVQAIPYHAVASLHTALAYRDPDTASHCQRVAEMSVALGRGLMSVTELYVLEIGALLHDIGKIGVPDSVLLKPGKLTPEEWKVMEAHARVGVEIVDSSFDSPELTEIVRWHHCRFDGLRQTPDMPSGQDIPLGARIVCIVDAFDAMVSDRVYRPGRPPEEAFEELRRCAGSQFDAELVERFISTGIGFRPDMRHGLTDMANKTAISIGQQTERIIRSFESRERTVLCQQLNELSRIAKESDLIPIAQIANHLPPMLADIRDEKEWEQVFPVVQDLIEMCLSIQRAHIRDLGARANLIEDQVAEVLRTKS